MNNYKSIFAKKAIKLFLFLFLFLFLSQPVLSFAEPLKSNNDQNQQNRTVPKVIAHGGGSYRGYETTNSVEAINQAIKNGYQVIELDMEISSDHKIIMLHDWDRTTSHYYSTSLDESLSEVQFLNLSVYGLLEVLTFDKLAAILDKNPDIRIVTDTKGNNLELLSLIAENYPEYQKQMIPQIYQYEEYEKAKDLGYTDIILTLYAQPAVDTQELTHFAKEKDLYAVTMPDYMAERSICKKVSEQGIVVYVHPVETMEEASHFFAQGAYGIYTGILLPGEFDGLEKEYYFSADGKNEAVKLTDQMIKSLGDLKMHGLKQGETVKYYVDGKPLMKNDTETLMLGKHKLAAAIIDIRGKESGRLDYLLWKDNNGLRVLHKKYEYRLESDEDQKDFSKVMEENQEPQEIIDLLSKSFITGYGRNYYYNNGIPGNYMNNKEKLTVQKNFYGKLLLPLSTTAKELGVVSVEMDRGRDVVITCGNSKSRSVIGSHVIRTGFQSTRLVTPITLYLNKAMADGEVYKYLTGRDYIQSDDVVVILPKGTEVNKDLMNQLLDASQKLFV